MPTVNERSAAYRIAALKELIADFDTTGAKGFEVARQLYNRLSDIDATVDICWVLRKTELADEFNSYADMAFGLGVKELNLLHPLRDLSEDGLADVIAALQAEIERLIQYGEEYMTWDDEDGYAVGCRIGFSGWWVRKEGMQDGVLNWVTPLNAE